MYYEANTQFPVDSDVPADRYLWLSQRTADGLWVYLDSGYWIPTDQLDILRDIDSLPVYDPLS